MNRRRWLGVAIGAGAYAVGAPRFNLGRYRLFANSAKEYSARAIELVGRSVVIDMLGPLYSPSKQAAMFAEPASFTAGELKQFKDSGVNVFHTAIGLGGPNAYLNSLKYISAWNAFLAHNDDSLMRIDSSERLSKVKSSSKIGVLLGFQNSEHFETPDDVNYFYSLGQRVSQLTYNARNLIGNGSTERHDDGLSDFGVAIVARMNQVGMAVDVSHCGDRTTLDTFEVSQQPVLITHSNCRAIAVGHPRCKSDEAITKMAATGGVMGITDVRIFVKTDEPTTIEDVLNHYDHVAKLVGVEHLGIGSDSDLTGYDAWPPAELSQLQSAFKGTYGFRGKMDIEGLNHPKRVFDLTEGLIRRKYNDSDIALILGGNFKRVLSNIWSA